MLVPRGVVKVTSAAVPTSPWASTLLPSQSKRKYFGNGPLICRVESKAELEEGKTSEPIGRLPGVRWPGTALISC